MKVFYLAAQKVTEIKVLLGDNNCGVLKMVLLAKRVRSEPFVRQCVCLQHLCVSSSIFSSSMVLFLSTRWKTSNFFALAFGAADLISIVALPPK